MQVRSDLLRMLSEKSWQHVWMAIECPIVLHDIIQKTAKVTQGHEERQALFIKFEPLWCLAVGEGQRQEAEQRRLTCSRCADNGKAQIALQGISERQRDGDLFR